MYESLNVLHFFKVIFSHNSLEIIIGKSRFCFLNNLAALRKVLRFLGYRCFIKEKEFEMKTTKIVLALASTLVLTQSVLASDIGLMTPSEHLKVIFEKGADNSKKPKDIPQILEDFKGKHTKEETQALCKEIKDSSFYAKAQKAGVGILKNRAMVTWCEGATFERAKLGKIVQKEKAPEVKREIVKLKPVNLGEKGQSVEGEQQQLDQAEKIISENLVALKQDKHLTIEQQKKTEALTIRLEEAKKILKESQEHYDNLSVAIVSLREDLKHFSFRHFKPKAHEKSTPEVYLDALNQSLTKEHEHILDSQSKDQLTQATKLLKQANENLANARKDLEAINREMLELTH
ncbi:hypothetical protein IM40_03005 [Candidatus Paracaedimonas acanthamoebae]|nr:hypothetical protein IM40_03005 [Candidatus Paracaedimonas acanthamoebae]